MKKLMIAAAAAAMVTGAFATDGSAYQVRFNLRTLEAQDVTCDGSAGCVLCGESWSDVIWYYRPTTRNLKAILARCIDCGESITNLNNYVFAMWEEAYGLRYTTSGMKNVIDNEIKTFQDNAAYQLNKYGVMNVRQFGSRGQYVSVDGSLYQNWSALDNVGLDIQFAGFGEGRTSDGRIGQVSGSVVGSMLPLRQGHYFNQTNAVCCAFDDLCNYQGLLATDDPITPANAGYVPAYGNWTMRSVDGARDMTFRQLTGNGAAILTK